MHHARTTSWLVALVFPFRTAFCGAQDCMIQTNCVSPVFSYTSRYVIRGEPAGSGDCCLKALVPCPHTGMSTCTTATSCRLLLMHVPRLCVGSLLESVRGEGLLSNTSYCLQFEKNIYNIYAAVYIDILIILLWIGWLVCIRYLGRKGCHDAAQVRGEPPPARHDLRHRLFCRFHPRCVWIESAMRAPYM